MNKKNPHIPYPAITWLSDFVPASAALTLSIKAHEDIKDPVARKVHHLRVHAEAITETTRAIENLMATFLANHQANKSGNREKTMQDEYVWAVLSQLQHTRSFIGHLASNTHADITKANQGELK